MEETTPPSPRPTASSQSQEGSARITTVAVCHVESVTKMFNPVVTVPGQSFKKFKFAEHSPLKEYLIEKMPRANLEDNEIVTLPGLIQLIVNITAVEHLRCRNNPNIILCDATLRQGLGVRQLHLCQISEFIVKQLVDTGDTTINMKVGNILHVSVDHPHMYDCPSPVQMAVLQLKENSRLMRIRPHDAFLVTSAFSEILRQSSDLMARTQRVFLYKDIQAALLKYICMNKHRFFDENNVLVCNVQHDPLGAAFRVKAFHRNQYVALMRTQLIPLDPHEQAVLRTLSPPPSEEEPTQEEDRVPVQEVSMEGNHHQNGDHSEVSVMTFSDNEESAVEYDIDENDMPRRARPDVDSGDTSEDDELLGFHLTHVLSESMRRAHEERVEAARIESDTLSPAWKCLKCRRPVPYSQKYCRPCWTDVKKYRPDPPSCPKKILKRKLKELEFRCYHSEDSSETPRRPRYNDGLTEPEDLPQDTESSSSEIEDNPFQAKRMCLDGMIGIQFPNNSSPRQLIVNDENLCVLCADKPIDAGFLHGKIVHRISCKLCAVKHFRLSQYCPYCREKVSRVVSIPSLQ